MLVFIMIYIFFKDKIEKDEKWYTFSEILAGLLTGPFILPITMGIKFFSFLLGIAIIMVTGLGTFFVSLITIPYITEKLFSFLKFSLYCINKIGFKIEIAKTLLPKDQLNVYMISLIALALLPYINEISIRITSFLFGFIHKQIIDDATRFIRKILNVSIIRAIIYTLTFILSMITLIFEFENTLYIKVIKEAMLSFIILDMVSNSIYNYIIDLRKRKTKLRRLEFLNLLKKTFNSDLENKDKYEVRKLLYELENDKNLIFYFECKNKDNICNKRERKEVISDKEFLRGFFWKYNKLKNINIILKKEYTHLLIDVKENIEYYEKVIILS